VTRLCVDDVARVLVVSAREPQPNASVRSLAQGSLALSVTRWDHTATVEIVGRPTVRGRAKAQPRTVGDAVSGDSAPRRPARSSRSAVPGSHSLNAAPNSASVPARHGLRRARCAAVLGVDSTNRAARSLLSDIADVTLKARSDELAVARAPLYYATHCCPTR